MNGTRHQFLAGTALAANQHSRFRLAPLATENGTPPSCGAFADHVVLQIDFRRQAKIFLFQPQQAARVFQHRGKCPQNAGHQFQVVPVKASAWDW